MTSMSIEIILKYFSNVKPLPTIILFVSWLWINRDTLFYVYRLKVLVRGVQLGLTSSATSDESQVVELGDLVFDQGRTVTQLSRTVLVVAGLKRDGRTVRHLGQDDHFERAGQRLVGPPVRRQGTAQHVRAPGADQLTWVFSGHLADGRLRPPEVFRRWRRRRRRRGRRRGQRPATVLVRRRAPAPRLLRMVIRRHPHQAHGVCVRSPQLGLAPCPPESPSFVRPARASLVKNGRENVTPYFRIRGDSKTLATR